MLKKESRIVNLTHGFIGKPGRNGNNYKLQLPFVQTLQTNGASHNTNTKAPHFQEQTDYARVWSSGPLWALRLGQVHRDEEAHGGVPGQLRVLCVSHQQSEYD